MGKDRSGVEELSSVVQCLRGVTIRSRQSGSIQREVYSKEHFIQGMIHSWDDMIQEKKCWKRINQRNIAMAFPNFLGQFQVLSKFLPLRLTIS
jgi:hypothetical protein